MTFDSSATEVILTGRNGIREATQIHAELSGAVAAHENIVVDCSNVTEADLTLIQLLIAAWRSAVARGGRLQVRQMAGGALDKALQRGGFLFGIPSDDQNEAGDPAVWVQAASRVAERAGAPA